MDIHLFSLLEGARAATGTVVIIDVYRAYTTAAASTAGKPITCKAAVAWEPKEKPVVHHVPIQRSP